jgi:signal transduction histidine kinase
MTTEKKQLLDKTFQTFVEVGLSGENVGILDDMVAKDIVGFGTTIDEKIFGVKEMSDLLLRQKKQSLGMDMKWKINTLDVHISSDENTAIFTNEVMLYITVEGNSIEMHLRFSVVLEYAQDKWLVVHWHGSKPEHVESEKDTWGIETWKEKAEALEKEVAERTSDLVEKNRELEIETALERVRSTSLAMHSSNDLSNVVYVVFTELVKLDAQLDRCLILIVDPQTLGITWYLTGKEGLLSNNGFLVPDNTHPSHQAYLEGWRTKRKKWQYFLAGEEKQRWDAFGFTETELAQLPDFIKADMVAVKAIHLTISSDDFGCLIASSLSPLSETHAGIVERFTIVFNQTYTRFLDLQRAEAQAREAQIEAALERVRSSSLAMHRSEELQGVVNTVVEQLKELNIESDTTNILIFNGELENVELWTGSVSTGKQLNSSWHVSFTENTTLKDIRQAQQSGEEIYFKYLSFQEKNNFFEYLFIHTDFKKLNPERKKFILESKRATIIGALVKDIGIQIISYSREYFLPEEIEILKRSAKVFEQAYTRFLDLQKAEAQAREAQIEASLERVRSKTMAMHNSEEVGESVAALFDELLNLGILSIQDRCGIGIMKPDEIMEVWTAAKSNEGKSELTIGLLEMKTHPLLRTAYRGWMDKKESLQYILEGEDKIDYHTAIQNQTNYKIKRDYFSEYSRIVHTDFYFKDGCLYVFSKNELSDNSSAVFSRFANVFGQTYRRYLDLQKAEAQAQEAEIEVALERVRSKALAMHNSNDLLATAGAVFSELRKLGFQPIRCGVGLLNGDSGTASLFHSISSEKGDVFHFQGNVPLAGHPVISDIYDSANKGEPCFPVLKGELLRTYYKNVLSGSEIPDHQPDYAEYGYFLSFTEGFFYGWANRPIVEAEVKILDRFKAIIDITFRRFIELQKMEANALESLRTASVDRVRAEIASMRTTSDLERIQPLVWNELKILSVPFIRCGVFIMDEEKQEVQVFLSTPNGKSMAAYHLPFYSTKQSKEIVYHWQQKLLYKDHMDEADFDEYAKNLVVQGALTGEEKYVTENRPSNLYLHFLPFAQGMLYVGNQAPLNEDELKLVQNLADAFSTAYARYEDFKKLDIAKSAVEAAMQELQQTQSQLVQQEKLASLGQLTAGIAHEIKNPLNFINNFSEVSVELIDEVLAELDQAGLGETKDEIQEILGSVRSNLNIIHQHGSRADGIVKSMLMHSRSGTGKKEPTDLNAMIRENVNLAFHAMRASKHPIGLETVLKLDESVGEVSLIIEDFSRVILNLCNNAIDAMREKMKKLEIQQAVNETEVPENRIRYVPRLTVMTRRLGEQVFMEIGDNGTGIPEEIRDKIFQPFFTTKKGTLGTGLGLSITHDIIKAHGGTLEIETESGKFSRFIISIT